MLFTESHEKIKRAFQHIDDLNAMLRDFGNSDFYSVHIDKDAEMFKDAGIGATFLRVEIDSSSFNLTDAALIMGDVLHNLRSALDLMYYQVVIRCGGTPTKWTRFPIRDTRQELIAPLNSALKQKQISPTVQAFILDTTKPYKAGNFAVWAVDDMNIMDKHKLLIPTLKLMYFHGIRLKDDKDNIISADRYFIDQSHTFRLSEWYGTNLTVHDKGHATATILFDLGTPFMAGQGVIPTLNGIAEEITRTIEAFDILIGRGQL
jgi:hypothetical protein